MNISGKWSSSGIALLAVFCAAMDARAGDWSETKPVLYRGDIVATYRARLAGEWLIVEAKHELHWHTYAMDNVQRAKKATGEESPTTELPTTIVVSGGLETVGGWKQTVPKDLTQKDINWYTWGFEGTARFAIQVKHTSDAPGVITVNGQLCNESLCSMVRDLKIEVPVTGDDAADEVDGLLDEMVEVAVETE